MSGGVQPLALPPHSPNLNTYAERCVGAVKEECLSKVILFGELDVTATIEQTLLEDPRIHDDRELFIRADKEARYGVVARVVAAARAAGVEGLNLLVDPDPQPLPSRTAR